MSKYAPNQTDIQIITQNVSTQATQILVAALASDDEGLGTEEIVGLHAELTTGLLDNVFAEIESRVKGYKAEAKSTGGRSSGGSRTSASGSNGSRSSGRSSSARKSSAKASAKQVKFATDLLETREHDYDYDEDDLADMSMTDMKALISELLEAPELD